MDALEYEGKQYVVASDLAREAGVSRTAVYQLIDRGVLPSLKVLGRRLVPLEEALRWKEKPHGNFTVVGNRTGAGRPRKTQKETES